MTKEQSELVQQAAKERGFIVGWMKSADCTMFMNEQESGGGFVWEFADFEPKDLTDYAAILIVGPDFKGDLE